MKYLSVKGLFSSEILLTSSTFIEHFIKNTCTPRCGGIVMVWAMFFSPQKGPLIPISLGLNATGYLCIPADYVYHFMATIYSYNHNNKACHKAKFRKWFYEHEFSVSLRPSHSPDLNPADIFWEFCRNCVKQS